MAKKAKHVSKSEPEEYELMPHREIEELKEELRKLKEFEITPTKKMHVSLVELNKKLDKLLQIFDEARHEIRTEEIGLGFKEKMKPLTEKMDKLLEQQADIAEGMVALADIVKGERKALPKPRPAPPMRPPGMPPARSGMPPGPPPRPAPGMPPPRAPPAPPRKKRFGII
ncbi:hypothetical protein KY346_01300 [Candidatus Woesearchaeota archaeon]|nr:hypothetical protein [Candidatus Woesearchaeota archaeon]